MSIVVFRVVTPCVLLSATNVAKELIVTSSSKDGDDRSSETLKTTF
jgi:hypothetical protein